MSSKVNMNLIENIEKTINEVNRLEEEESKKILEQKKLNNNNKEINLITKIFIFDEQKLLLEIQKADYLIKKEKELKDCKISKYKFKKKKKQKKEKKV